MGNYIIEKDEQPCRKMKSLESADPQKSFEAQFPT